MLYNGHIFATVRYRAAENDIRHMSHEAQQMSSPVISQELKSIPDASVQMTQTHKAPSDYPLRFLEVEDGSAWLHFLRDSASSVQSFICARAESVKLRELLS